MRRATRVPALRVPDPLCDPQRHRRRLGLLGLMLLLACLLHATEFSLASLLSDQSLSAVAGFAVQFSQPALDHAFLTVVARATRETVLIALAGVALGWVLAVPLTLLSTSLLSQSAIGRPMARLPRAMRRAVRALLVVLRSVPELVFALLFVRIAGLGATAGVLAIALSYVGMFGKVYGEILESVDPAPTEALLRNGGGRVNALLYGALPGALPELASYTVFRWECALRSSVVLGFVGAGGLGQQMDLSLKMLEGSQVATLLLVFVALVALSDLVSRGVRRALDAGHARAVLALLAALLVAGPIAVDLRWAPFLEQASLRRAAEFVAGFAPPAHEPAFLSQALGAGLETLAMSLLGTLLGALLATPLAILAARPVAVNAAETAGGRGPARVLARVTAWLARGLGNLMRATPELVWAALWAIAAGLGPLPGTLALAAHTAGVFVRLFGDTLENLPPAPAAALRHNGSSAVQAFGYATLPLAAPQLMSYLLYRWENNIRAAAVLGFVGAGGLGQMMYYHLSLFQMREVATVTLFMVLIVLLVDAISQRLRRRMQMRH